MWQLLIDFISLFILRKHAHHVTPEQIDHNMRLLKKRRWFQSFLLNGKYRQTIIHDKDVRLLIGKMKKKKLIQSSYEKRQQHKIERMLIKKQHLQKPSTLL